MLLKGVDRVGRRTIAGGLKSAGARRLLAEFCRHRPDLEQATEGLARTAELLCAAFRRNGTLFICGNGGSFADALHVKSELGKSFERARPVAGIFRRRVAKLPYGKLLAEKLEDGFPVVVLGESGALRSAFANDREPVLVYAQELHSFLGRGKKPAVAGETGIFWGFSTSGRSGNVVAAATVARAHGLPVVALTGPHPDSPLARAADIAVLASGRSTAEIQENHLPLYHLACRLVEAELFPRGRRK